MKRKIIFLTALLLLGVYYASAQQNVSVSGVVTDGADGSPVIGASVQVKGTSTGTVTGIDGKYSLHAPQGSVLVFSYLGMKNQEVTANRNVINVIMQVDAKMLNEVVAIGYGTARKSDLSGASFTLGEEKLKGSVITNLDQALQGRVAGVNSIMTSGAPGSSISIQVRGQGTLNANQEPLYVIDGVIVQGGSSKGADYGLSADLGNGNSGAISPLSALNPSDILSMEILKDASATAIYGAQGANGVVLITTKRGKAGEAKFSYEGLSAFQVQNARLDMMNLRQYAEYNSSVAGEIGNISNTPAFQDPSLLGRGTNWQDAVFQHAWMQQHQLSVQGGSDKVKYYVSGSYMNQDGTIIGTEFSRYSFRSNLDADLKSWVKLGLNVNYSGTDERLGVTNGEEGLIYYSLQTPPDIPIYDIDGNYASTIRDGYSYANPIAIALMNDYLLNRNKLNGSIFADITPVKNLVWHAELGYDINNSKGEVFKPTYDFGNISKKINESAIRRNNNLYWQLKNYLTYSGNVDKHRYTAMLGHEAWESKWEYIRGVGSGLTSNEVHSPQLGESQTVESGFGSSAMVSVFARLTYNYDDRYLATYTFRRDGSSNFGPKNRWANFNSFAASWRFTNEAFLESLKDILSNGKLRIGWGQTGNANIGGYAWGSPINSMPTGLGMGYRPTQIANPYIQWETQEQLNLGIDLGFFKDRINLTIDLYDKTSKNMLMSLNLPSYMGTQGNSSSRLNAPRGNFGDINNKGLEIALNTHNIVGKTFSWDTDFQISFNKNKLVALAGASSAPILGYPQWEGQGNVVTVTNVGGSLYPFYGYVFDGYYKDLEDIQNSPKDAKSYPADGVSFKRDNTVWPGDMKFKDISGPDGKPDGIIDEYDRTIIGSPIPKFNFGLTNTFRYKDFDLSIFINGTYGNKIYNYTAVGLSDMKTTYRNQLSYISDRARLESINPNISYDGTNGVWHWYDDINNVRIVNGSTPSAPRAVVGDPNNNARVSDRYIEDGSYLRIKNIILGYTLPARLTQKYKIENVRIYANIQNLYTLTKYSGYDPEVGVNPMTPNVIGLDYGRYPSPTVYSLGLNFSF